MRESRWGYPIIDFHCHFPVVDPEPPQAEEEYRRRFGSARLDLLKANWQWYQEQWWSAWNFPIPEDPEAPADVQVARWAAEIERGGLETVVFLTGGGNDTLASVVAEQPRMLGFAHHDPFAPGAAAELRRAVVEGGLRGYKIIAPALAGPIDHDDLLEVWQTADELGIPVLVHFGSLDGGGGTAAHVNISPLRLHDVAKAFPSTAFVVPHFGCSYPGDLLQLTWACRNVLVDTSGNNEWIRWMPYPLTLADLFRKFLETIGPERVVFGSDSAHFPRGLVDAYYEEQTRIVAQLGLSAADRHAIFAGNAARLLGVPPGGPS